MSEENKNLEENANEKFENLKENAKESFEDAKEAVQDAKEEIKETVEEVVEDVKESTEDFTTEAKKSANEFSENLNELTSNQENKKIMAGILALVFGSLGVHKFILGYKQEGFILLGTTILSYVLMCVVIGMFTVFIPLIIGFIEGIIYLTKSDEEFYQTYQVNKKPWF